MRMTLGSQVAVYNPTPKFLDWCKRTLTFPNPEFIKKSRMGFWTGNTPQTISLYEMDGTTALLPYGTMYQAMAQCEGCDLRLDLATPRKVDYEAEIPLYDYQEQAAESMSEWYCGILDSPPGSGKTQIMLSVAASLQRRALWIVHTVDLVNQARNRALMYMPEELTGTITGGKVDIGECITFATVQTLSQMDLRRYRYTWDIIIVDECHRISGSPTQLTMYSKVLNNLAARRKYGMTGTTHRSDGMIEATYALIGRVVYEVPPEAVADKIMPVSILPRSMPTPRSWDYTDTDGMLIHTKLISYLAENKERNEMIVSDLIENMSHYNLILSDRVEHLRNLYAALPPILKANAAVIDGKMTSKKARQEREQALEDMRTGHKRYLFATYSLAKEGLDIPRLDRLYLTTPHKDYAVIKQAIGRVARVFDGKEQPIAYDYVDGNIDYCIRSYKKRCTTYRKAGCSFLE